MKNRTMTQSIKNWCVITFSSVDTQNNIYTGDETEQSVKQKILSFAQAQQLQSGD